MPLSKKDAPANADAKAAKEELIDEGAGVPEGPMTEAAEALPEEDEVEKATKEAMLAEDAQTEAKAKLKAAEASPDALDTPSGAALKKAAGVADDEERKEVYQREKAAKRWGS